MQEKMAFRDISYRRLLFGIAIAIITLSWVVPFSSVMKRNFDNIILLKNLSFSPYEYLFRIGSGLIKDRNITGDVTWRFILLDGYESQVDGIDDQPEGVLYNIAVPRAREDLYWLAKGGLVYLNGNEEEAIKIWRNVPGIIRYLLYLSSNAQGSQVSDIYLNLSIAIRPTSIAYYELGIQHLESHEETDAIAMFEQAAIWAGREDDTNLQSNSYLAIGDIYLGQKKNLQALKYYEIAQNLMDRLPPGEMVMMARAHIMLEHYDEAELILNSIISDNYDSPRAWWWLGELERIRGNRVAATEAYVEYKKLNPDNKLVDQRLELLEK